MGFDFSFDFGFATLSLLVLLCSNIHLLQNWYFLHEIYLVLVYYSCNFLSIPYATYVFFFHKIKGTLPYILSLYFYFYLSLHIPLSKKYKQFYWNTLVISKRKAIMVLPNLCFHYFVSINSCVCNSSITFVLRSRYNSTNKSGIITIIFSGVYVDISSVTELVPTNPDSNKIEKSINACKKTTYYPLITVIGFKIILSLCSIR